MQKYLLTKRESSRQASLRKKIQIIVIGGIIFSLLFFLVPKLVSGVVYIAWRPFDIVRVWVTESSDSLPQYLRDRSTLVEELQSLKAAAVVDLGNENTISKLQFENDQLRALVGEVPKERLLARVIARPNELPYDMLMLDRGTENGVTLHSPVFLGRDQLIGVVSDVRSKTSLVSLVTTSGFVSTAYVIGPNIYTFAEGMGGGILRVRIPQGIPLNVDDLVILPAVSVTGVFGSVTEVITSPTQPEQYGFVTLSSPLQSIQYVSVGTEAVVPQTYDMAREQVNTLVQSLLQIDLPAGVLVTPETASTTATSTATSTSP